MPFIKKSSSLPFYLEICIKLSIMLQLKYQSYSLPFQFPFVTSKGIKAEQSTLILSLGLGRFTGYGEATSIAYYNADVAEMIVLLEKNKAMIERYALTSPERFWHFLHHLLPGNNFLISALDIAGWDLWSQMNQRPLYALLGLQWKNIPVTDYSIGMASNEEIEQRVALKPWPVYKLKLGNGVGLEAVQALRRVSDATIRVDVNEGWSLDEAKDILPRLEAMGIELVEQPLHRSDFDGLQELKKVTSLPIIADEACHTLADLENCLELYDGINIKLSKCGGITPALEMIRKIKDARKKVMLGGMCESVVGATALAHLLPLADYADIDGPLLLKENVGEALSYDNGNVSLPMRPGLGIFM